MRLLLLLAFVGYAPSLLAEWYQVEVLVFQHVYPDTDGEFWRDNPGLPARDGSIQLIEPEAAMTGTETSGPAQTNLVPYMAFPPARFRLDGVERVLKSAREYRPLVHVAWQQPGSASGRSQAVHLERAKTEPGTPVRAAGSQTDLTPADPLIDGTVRLRVTRFLYLDVDVAFFPDRMQALPEGGAAPGGAADVERNEQAADYVRLQQSRKILLNELHYFDHPLFGVLAQVSRLQLPGAPDAGDAAAGPD